MAKIAYDEQCLLQQFKKMKLRINEHFDAQNEEYKQQLAQTEYFDKELKKATRSVEKVMFSKNAIADQKTQRQEYKRISRKFNETIKTMKVRKPCFEYKSFLAHRHAKYQDFVNGNGALHVNDDEWLNEIQTAKNALVFAEGCLYGMVPIAADRVDVSLTNSFEEREV